jgi:hypothetical protein
MLIFREKKCNAMNTIRRLSVYHEDLVVNNIHSIVLALLQEVKPSIYLQFISVKRLKKKRLIL